MIGGVGNDVLESGAGSNVMFGDNGRVTFVNDRFSVAETLDIAYGGDDILLAGTGGNFMLGGRGSDMFRGSFSKDVMVGDFAAIYFDLSGSRVVNLTRFGPGGNSPDLITRSLEALYSWPGTLACAASGFRTRLDATQRGLPVRRPRRAGWRPRQRGAGASGYRHRTPRWRHFDLCCRRCRAWRSQHAWWRGRVGRGPKHGAVRSGRTEAPWDGAHQEQDQEEQQQGRQADGQEQDPRPRASAGEAALQPSAAPDRAPDEHAALAAGVGVLGLSGALGATGSVVFNSKTNTWENKARRKTGVRMIRQDMPLEEAQALSEDE